MYFAIVLQNTKCCDLRTFQGNILVNNSAIKQFWTLCNSVQMYLKIFSFSFIAKFRGHLRQD